MHEILLFKVYWTRPRAQLTVVEREVKQQNRIRKYFNDSMGSKSDKRNINWCSLFFFCCLARLHSKVARKRFIRSYFTSSWSSLSSSFFFFWFFHRISFQFLNSSPSFDFCVIVFDSFLFRSPFCSMNDRAREAWECARSLNGKQHFSLFNGLLWCVLCGGNFAPCVRECWRIRECEIVAEIF